MGSSTPYSGTALPPLVATASTFSLSNFGLFYRTYQAKRAAIDATIGAVVASPGTYAGGRSTAVQLQQAASLAVGTGVLDRINVEGHMTGTGTLFITEVKPGDRIEVLDDSNPPQPKAFTVIEVWNNTSAIVINQYGDVNLSTGGGNQYRISRDNQLAMPLILNPDVYMTTANTNSTYQTNAMSNINTAVGDPAFEVAPDVMNGSGNFADTLTEEQLGLNTFVDVATAKAELQKSVEAANVGLAAASAVILAADPGNIAATIATFVNPLVNALIAQRDADLLSVQKGYAIANGFFNTNISDRVAEIINKYAIQSASLEAEAGFKAFSLLNTQAVQTIDMLLKFQNGPLRDRIIAQELRLKAIEVGSRVYLAADQGLMARWSLLYAGAQDAAKRDYANDTAMWAGREDVMRFSAELSNAYMGQVSAGIGKGIDASGVAKMTLGAAIAGAGIAATIMTGGAAAPLGAAAVMSGGSLVSSSMA